MNRKVLLTITGFHSGEEADNGSVETVTEAEYFQRNGSHYLLYEEKDEDSLQTTKCRMKIKENMVELTRQGLLNSNMIFEKGKTHTTSYQTPYGQLYLGIRTDEMSVQEGEREIRIEISYVLEADGEYLSDSRITISIKEQ